MPNSDHLIVFTRFPIPGETKTRLIPALGAEGAADLQCRMTEHTVAQARKVGARIEIRWTGGDKKQMRGWLGDDLQYAEQGDGDLGERMARAFQDHFNADAERVVIVGCDCPANGWKNISDAFRCLKKVGQASSLSRQPGWLSYVGGRSECVLGPAADGGYYLIGLRNGRDASPRRPRTARRAVPTQREAFPVEIFQNIDWGTERVLRQTLAAAPCKPVLLPKLGDVDLPENIPAKISVVIPAFNEADHIAGVLEKVTSGFDVECIVADGISKDETVLLADQAGARIVQTAPGRAAQMNAGAKTASGEILLFLHADTELPDNWDFIVRNAFKNPRVLLGAFRFRVKERLRGIGLVEWGTNIRSRVFRRPYGDQGLFLCRGTFEKLGGFPEQPILEDVQLVRRARRLGKIVTVREAVLTSGRRWQKHGVFRTTLINQLILFGNAFGVPPEKLRRLYG